MNWSKMKAFLVFTIFIVPITVAQEDPVDDSLDTGYLYEKPDKGLLTPVEMATELPQGITEGEIPSPTTEAAKEEISPEVITFTAKPEVKSPDSYLPPEEENSDDDPFAVVVKENLEISGSKALDRKQKNQVVKRKINAAEKKVRVRQILGLPPRPEPGKSAAKLKDGKKGSHN